MDWVLFEAKSQVYLSPSQQPPPPPVPPSLQSVDTSFNKISPSILLIIIILAIIFFISGLLHLLIRFLLRPTNRENEDEVDNVTALQGQLQQLFHLHDSGVDQSYIDTLPVFLYKAIIGLKNPFDCAVCLCEFEDDDKLRLLPKCSHAFHLECIDTWLLSHSTCPLCRGSLLADFPYTNSACSPVVLLLESGGDASFREIASERDCASCVVGEDEFGDSCSEISDKEDLESGRGASRRIGEEKVVSVKLGKFRNVDPAPAPSQGSSNSNNVDARRCFSMGSFEYVLDESSSLQVSIKPQVRKQTSKKPSIPLTPAGHRAAMSECDCHSAREGFKEFDALRSIGKNGNSMGRNKKDSFSFSKIWLQNKREKPSSVGDSSRRRASSFQKTESADDFGTRTISEMDISRWESSAASETEEAGTCNRLDSQPSMPSFARKTLLWLAGKQNKVLHSSSPDI